ncbi:DUF983 domain-containing protein [Bauldia litoralis]|uniref:Uncharacterized conserved protein, DUF983 family n=1 Tax=Bauldia litoralis TaxID=665467 RepID=A0A1G6A0J8_9HYPH|nr:DUF983 domain-containing protein [Bauldia litoralis]SDB01974.1 Uncharacterized conserved protein, DUF983 family [Bauldia litoralis]
MENTEQSHVWQASAELNDLGLPKRPAVQAMKRGFFCRCPNCGEGALFNRYLKSVPECAQCGEDLSHHRADDAPPYFTIMIVGHIVVPLMLAVFLVTEWSNLTHMAVWLPLTLAMTLLLLQPVKGTIIGLQWALYMHGFDTRSDPDAMPEGYLPREASAEGV